MVRSYFLAMSLTHVDDNHNSMDFHVIQLHEDVEVGKEILPIKREKRRKKMKNLTEIFAKYFELSPQTSEDRTKNALLTFYRLLLIFVCDSVFNQRIMQ